MKKITLPAIFLFAAFSADAQYWKTDLNNGNDENLNFGTNSEHPVNFFTNDTLRMKLGVSGKLGIGTGTCQPATELEVNGGVQVNNGLRVGEGFYIGAPDNYGLIRYIPGSGGNPSIFNFGGGGINHPNNPNPGSSYNPYKGGHGGNEHSPDPPPNNNCVNGNNTTINVFKDMLCVKKLGLASSLIGNINVGHNGVNAFIETQGTNPNYPNAGDLYLNAECNRNIYAFGNGGSFAIGADHVMSVAGRFNVTQNMQIGGGTALGNFLYNTAALYINAPATTAASGLRIYHGGGNEAGIKIVELSDVRRGFALYKGSSNTDNGSERFSIFGDGKTVITTHNTDALNIVNGTGGPTTFNIKADGKTYIADAVGIGTQPSSGSFLTVDAGSNSSNADLLLVGSNATTDALKVSSKGMMQINTTGISSGSVFKIRNQSAGTELFAVRHDGVAFAREVIVTLGAFPDYVFDKDYALLKLEEVKAYIEQNKRLPHMPSATEVAQGGASIGELQRITVEKVEELYLYIFQLEEKINALSSQLKSIEEKKK